MHIESISNLDTIFILGFNKFPLHFPKNDQCILQSRQFCIQFIFQIVSVLNHSQPTVLHGSRVASKVQEECTPVHSTAY